MPENVAHPTGARVEKFFAELFAKAVRIRLQEQHQRGPKLYSWRTPEAERIGNGKARAPWEFGAKISLVTISKRSKGGQFVLHAKASPGASYDGHMLKEVLAGTIALTGRDVERSGEAAVAVVTATIPQRSLRAATRTDPAPATSAPRAPDASTRSATARARAACAG